MYYEVGEAAPGGKVAREELDVDFAGIVVVLFDFVGRLFRRDGDMLTQKKDEQVPLAWGPLGILRPTLKLPYRTSLRIITSSAPDTDPSTSGRTTSSSPESVEMTFDLDVDRPYGMLAAGFAGTLHSWICQPLRTAMRSLAVVKSVSWMSVYTELASAYPQGQSSAADVVKRVPTATAMIVVRMSS